MKKILKIDQKGKSMKARQAEIVSLREYGDMESASKVALIQALIPLGLMHIQEVLEREVIELAGEKYSRQGGLEGHSRWTRQKGHVYINDQRIPVKYQRVRDTINNREAKLEVYESFGHPTPEADDKLLKRVLHGLSCGNYRECSEAIPEALSLSPSTVSRRFIKASRKKLREIIERRLDGYDFVAVVMDGKRFGDDGIIIATGITIEGRKVFLGLVQSAGESSAVCRDFLRGLVERGLRYEHGLLFVIDGAKGFKRAIADVFGASALVQRCQWHKRENVLEYLPKGIRETFRRKLQTAYSKPDYEKARSALLAVRRELILINESAASSLDEGLEETLTIQRLGLHKELSRSFTTTNMIESILAQVAQKTDKVDYWKNSSQKQRWVASALMHIEPRLNRANGYRHLPALRKALKAEIAKAKKERKAVAA